MSSCTVRVRDVHSARPIRRTPLVLSVAFLSAIQFSSIVCCVCSLGIDARFTCSARHSNLYACSALRTVVASKRRVVHRSANLNVISGLAAEKFEKGHRDARSADTIVLCLTNCARCLWLILFLMPYIVCFLSRLAARHNNNNHIESLSLDWNRDGSAMVFNEPYFETKESNVTAPLGGTAYLMCKIRNLGDRTVSFLSFAFFTLSCISVGEKPMFEKGMRERDFCAAIIDLRPVLPFISFSPPLTRCVCFKLGEQITI